MVAGSEGNILVDTGPELRVQALAVGLRRVDAVLMTHTHADHIFGMDDLRRFNDITGNEIPVYGTESVLEDIRRIFRYIFIETQAGGGKPRIDLRLLEPAMDICGLHVTPLPVWHGRVPVMAYRFDEMTPRVPAHAAYVTDVSAIPAESLAHLHDLDLLILDAVRFEPHPTHFGLYQALDVIAELRPRRALLTHLSHHFGHEEVNATLPDHVRLAYDGQVAALPE